MPDDFEIVETLSNGGQRIRFISGPLAHRVVIAFPDRHPYFHTGLSQPYERPEKRADRLLRSLLNPEQLRDWTVNERFRVTTPYGIVELGELFNIGFWTPRGDEYRLCVVPTQNHGLDMPIADQWINLLLVLRSDPERFFTVANWRKSEGRQFMRGPVPGLCKAI